jgi:hypothetical protein
LWQLALLDFAAEFKFVVVIRCTQKLLRRVGPAARVAFPSTTRLGDWVGNLVGVGHRRVVLFISEYSRLPVLLSARDLRNVAYQLPLAMESVLAALEISHVAIREEQRAMADAVIAPTNNRSLVATLADLGYALKLRLAKAPEVDLLTLALWLSETPIGPMEYQAPDEVTRRLLA